mmetsp:Transcript_19796/g.54442  ORF Transcript_19796/g.54442 Transcript_19796/m.54442 type:complete len:201 (+) Transcript_19796:318-920(+)
MRPTSARCCHGGPAAAPLTLAYWLGARRWSGSAAVPFYGTGTGWEPAAGPVGGGHATSARPLAHLTPAGAFRGAAATAAAPPAPRPRPPPRPPRLRTRRPACAAAPRWTPWTAPSAAPPRTRGLARAAPPPRTRWSARAAPPPRTRWSARSMHPLRARLPAASAPLPRRPAPSVPPLRVRRPPRPAPRGSTARCAPCRGA